jgi:hypothetical protein
MARTGFKICLKSYSILGLILGRNIMRDNMLVNVSGLEGHAIMSIDNNIEHLIGELKV